jgi:hypothetical protein
MTMENWNTTKFDGCKEGGTAIVEHYGASTIVKREDKSILRVMFAVPTTGLVRMEWVMARYNQVIPCNWSNGTMVWNMPNFAPIGYMVADARNACALQALEGGWEWLFFIDHDVMLSPNFTLKINEFMMNPVTPLFSGLYFTKSCPAEPLVYRGRGNGYYADWHMGDQVWVDGLPMGCTMIHRKLLEEMAKVSETYNLSGKTTPKIFKTPAQIWWDPESMDTGAAGGTEDLNFCTEVMEKGILEKAGWPELQKEKYPFLIDTSLFCKHIDQNGVQFPTVNEDSLFRRKDEKITNCNPASRSISSVSR